MEAYGAIVVSRYAPTGSFVGKKIHVQNGPAAAWADHRGLLLKAFLLNHIESSAP
jgi:hypothetical protein